MKNIIYILLSLTFTTTIAQDRNTFWVHGLGDDADFWSQQSTKAQRAYRIRTMVNGYDTDEGVQRYADRLRNDSRWMRGNQTIAIGHSLGGVAIRQANRDDNGLYGGMITLGSPLDGARLANEVINGRADRFVQQSIAILRRGPIASQSRSAWQKFMDTFRAVLSGNPRRIVSGLIRTFGSEKILEVLDEVSSGLRQGILDNFDPNNPTVRDLAENSDYMTRVRNFRSTQPKILAWGNENSPVHVRLLSSNLSGDGREDSKIILAYHLAGNTYKVNADGTKTSGFLWSRKRKRRKRREKEAWNAGADYIKRGWEIAWNELTDARYLVRYTTTRRVYVCNGRTGGPFSLTPVDEMDDCLTGLDYSYSCNCRWENRRVTRSRWVNTPSDGLIKRGSARGDLSRWGNTRTVELRGVNHLEMGVHSTVDRLFRDAFNGRHGRFFTTARRR